MAEKPNPTGSSNERPRAQKPRARAARYSPNHTKRNTALGIAAASLSLLVALGAYKYFDSQDVNNPDNIFITKPEATYSFPAAIPNSLTITGAPINAENLQGLVNTLQTERGDKVSRTQAVVRNFSRIGYENQNLGFASAERVSDEGIYITAAHALVDKQNNFLPGGIYVETPMEGPNAYRIQAAITDWDSDAAIFYAPTGKSSSVTTNIQLRDNPEAGERAWSLGAQSRRPNTSTVAIITGIYNPNSSFNRAISGSLSLEGMTPRPGNSGGPIIDSEGRIIGMVSGSLYEGTGAKTRNDSKGTAAVSINSLRELLKKPLRSLASTSR